MSAVRFPAPELRRDGTIAPATWGYERTADGWRVLREDAEVFTLGPGYRLLATSHAGICATDLARVHLPFPLPQVTGHEVVAIDDGRPVLVEINASHRARGLPETAWCAQCRAGLDTHCPDRLVLGIDRLVGGFAPWMLVPSDAVVPVPVGLDVTTAVLAEPFAAAWHAVATIDARDGMTVAVLGLGRLGLLLVAALDAWRAMAGRRIDVVGVTRRSDRTTLASLLGAGRVVQPGAETIADVVIDATGAPDGLVSALAMARSRVHLKSTSGAPAAGLADPTALVVDEIGVEPWRDDALGAGAVAVVLARDPGGRVVSRLEERGVHAVAGGEPDRLAAALDRDHPLGADAAVVDSVAAIDAVVRPRAGVQRALIRPRGRIFVTEQASDDGPLGRAVAGRGMRLDGSRCGSIPKALAGMAAVEARLDARRGASLGALLVTGSVSATRLGEGWKLARAGEHLKVLVRHPTCLI